MGANLTMTLTIIVVSYNSESYLDECLTSVFAQTTVLGLQVVVVDNASHDQSFVSSLPARYPSLEVLVNAENLGFAKACNQAIRKYPAHFYLLLNPDCVVLNGAIDKCLEYLQDRSSVGIVGCRVQNPDGSLQLACRRGIPRPSVALYRFLGLSRLFPNSRRFGRYNFTYENDRLPHPVEAVSGSFLLTRAEVLNRIGLLDEDFFLYGEDLDFCYRAGKAGWGIMYYPDASVVHYKRRSSTQDSRASNDHFYNAMRIFYAKHFRAESGLVKNLTVSLGISCLHRAAVVRNYLLGRNDVGSDG